MTEFRFVFVPVDRTQGLEEWILKIESGKEVECLLDRLKEHFLMRQPLTEDQRSRHRSELLKQKGLKEGDVPEAMLTAATSMQLVESIALLPCMRHHDHIGITMYVDDAGSFKRLPINERASDIAVRCGMMSTVILGDAFLARVKENDEEFERMNFTLSDLSSSAQWMKDASNHHRDKLNAPMAKDILKNLKSKTKEPITSPIETAREQGNAAFKRGSYAEAVEEYSKALEGDKTSALTYSNRSMARLRLSQYSEALSDAEAALKLDGACVKAAYRKGLALDGLGREDEAREAYEAVLKLQPGNASVIQKLNERTSRKGQS